MALSPGPLAAPVPPRRPTQTVIHGVALTDDFAWLKAENWRDVLRNPAALPQDIRDYLVAENGYGAAVLAPLADLQETLTAEMRARIKEDDATVPVPDGPFAYYTRYRRGGQHPLIVRSDRSGANEQILVDGEALAKGKPFFHLGRRQHSDDHRLLAWSADEAGSEFYTIRVRDLATGADLADAVSETTGEAVWTSAGDGFYYVRLDANHRPRQVFFHRLGDPASADRLIHDEPETGWFVDIEGSRSGRFLFISTGDHETSEVRFLDRDDPAATLRLIAPRQRGVRYEVAHLGRDFAILTNADGAEDFKIVTAPIEDPSPARWVDLVPHRPGVIVLSITAFRDHLVRHEREDARPRIVIRRLADGHEHAIDMSEEAYSLRPQAGYEYATTQVRFVYSSMTTPAETYDYDMVSGQRTLLKRQEVPSGHDPASYVTRRLFATAADGEAIPVSILHRRDLVLDGRAPLLLYGYGAYGSSMPADFDTRRLSLVDRGFVYAIAHIRGGTEKGWRWYTQGKREHKVNSFSDFIACARMLADQGYTSPGRIVAQGRSAGGMLMGAVANLAPELFAAVVAEVPFVDVLTTMLDGSLPLTPPEWPEWGNPGANAADFQLIRGYSPVDQVSAQRYPAILAVGGLTDPRVTYWEPAKWVAQLRSRMLGGGPVVLRIDMDSGHAGASGRFDRLHEVAQSYAFAIGAVTGQLKG